MGLAGRLWGAKCTGMCQNTSKPWLKAWGRPQHVDMHGYGRWREWVHVSGVLVWHVRAVGAHGEGLSTCIGGLGVARCGRSAGWGRVEASHMPT